MMYLDRRVEKLTRQQEWQKAFVSDPEHAYFKVSASCPPSLSLHMRGGLMYEYQDIGDAWFVDDITVDLSDPDQIGTKSFTFTSADYYLGYVLRLTGGAGPTFYVSGSDTEFATAGEAEEDLMDYIQGTNYIWHFNYPLCGLILRNNGTLGTGYNILPVDTVNRGRSYIWPRDLRPRNIAL